MIHTIDQLQGKGWPVDTVTMRIAHNPEGDAVAQEFDKRKPAIQGILLMYKGVPYDFDGFKQMIKTNPRVYKAMIKALWALVQELAKLTGRRWWGW